MKIGLTELLLILCIFAVAVGPDISRWARLFRRSAKRTYTQAQRRRAVAAIERRTEREITFMRLQRFGYCIGAAVVVVVVYALFLRPIEAAPQRYTAPAVRDAAARRGEPAAEYEFPGYEDVSCVKTRDGSIYFSAKNADGEGALARMKDDGSASAEILTVEGSITAFDFDEQGDIWFTRVGKRGGELCRASYDGWGASAEQVVTQINGAALHCPSAVAVGADGKVYFADAAELSPKNGVESLLRTELLAHTATGSVYVYDPAALSVQRVLSGVAGASGLALSPDGDALYVCDLASRCVWQIPVESRGLLAGSKDCAVFAAALPGYPGAVAVDADGTVYVSYRWARSGWLEAQAGSTLLRGTALRLLRSTQAKLFGLSKNDAAAEAFSSDGTPQAALYLPESADGLSGREPGVFWAYRVD